MSEIRKEGRKEIDDDKLPSAGLGNLQPAGRQFIMYTHSAGPFLSDCCMYSHLKQGGTDLVAHRPWHIGLIIARW